MRVLALAVLACLAWALGGCGPADFRLGAGAGLATGGTAGTGAPVQPAPATAAASEAQYARLFPTYAELCALSEIQKNPGFGADIRSGPGGHEVMYLQGACRDPDAGYPVLRLCSPADRDRPEYRGEPPGVGISSNSHYVNASWVAVPSRAFFFHGLLRPGERLDRAAYRRTQAEAERLGILGGIAFHPWVFEGMPPGTRPADWMHEVSVSTDWATSFGRGRYCARVPLTRAQMGRAVEYLNEVNGPYRRGEKIFEWSVLRDNCSHLIHNALAAAGVWAEWPVRQGLVWSALNFPVPKNEFVNLARRTNDLDLDDPGALYDDPAARTALLRDGALPTAPGALSYAEPPWQPNDLYKTRLRLIFYDEPTIGSYVRRFRAMDAQPRYTSLRGNLRWFRDRYARVLAERRPLAWWLARRAAAERDGFAQFYARFYEYAGKQAAQTAEQLAALGGDAEPTPTPAPARIRQASR